MDLLHMRYVTAIADHQSMTKAAEELHVSQSAISLSCKRLEEELGVKLFLRDGRQLRLTEAGNILCQRARTILSLADELSEAMRPFSQRDGNAIRLGSEAIDFSSELIALYRKFVPSADIWTDNPTKLELLEKLCHREYDLAVTLEDFTGAQVESTLLLEEPMLALVWPSFPLGRDESLTMARLDGEDLVTTSEEYRIGALMRSFFSEAGVRYNRIQLVGDTDAISVKVYNAFGVSFVPEVVVNLWLKTPQLQVRGIRWVSMADDSCRRGVYLTRLRDEAPSAACTAFMDFLDRYSAFIRTFRSYPTYDEFLPYL